LALQAIGLSWLALVTSPTVGYSSLWPPFVVSGVGMALFFVPLASVVLSSVRPEQEGVASGANSAFREVGGVLGIAVLGAVFSARGGYGTVSAYVAGLVPAVWVGVAVVAVGAVVALALPRRLASRAETVSSDAAVVPSPTAGPVVAPDGVAPAGLFVVAATARTPMSVPELACDPH
jgi:hypothetical protein